MDIIGGVEAVLKDGLVGLKGGVDMGWKGEVGVDVVRLGWCADIFAPGKPV